MSEFVKAISYGELEEGTIQAVQVDGTGIALYKVAGHVYATGEMCAHDDCFGKIVEGDQVACICHGARFRIEDGAVTRLPATVPLKTFPVKVENDEVWVAVEE